MFKVELSCQNDHNLKVIVQLEKIYIKISIFKQNTINWLWKSNLNHLRISSNNKTAVIE